jgi:hypothetical protein
MREGCQGQRMERLCMGLTGYVARKKCKEAKESSEAHWWCLRDGREVATNEDDKSSNAKVLLTKRCISTTTLRVPTDILADDISTRRSSASETALRAKNSRGWGSALLGQTRRTQADVAAQRRLPRRNLTFLSVRRLVREVW